MSTIERIVDRLNVALAGTGAVVASVEGDSVGIDGSPKTGRRIEVYVRDASDFDVGFHVPGKQGSPFEQPIVGDAREAEEVQRSVVQFVADLVAERVVLVMDARLIRGGRRFTPTADVSEQTLRQVSWIVSWRGTYDSDALNGRGDR